MSDLATSFCISFEEADKLFFYLLSFGSHHNIFFLHYNIFLSNKCKEKKIVLHAEKL